MPTESRKQNTQYELSIQPNQQRLN